MSEAARITLRGTQSTGFLGRRVILTTLDPLPRPFRAAPGVFAMNHREAAALRAGDGAVFKELAEIAYAEDDAEMRRVFVVRKWKRPKKKIKPSSRLFLLNAIYQRPRAASRVTNPGGNHDRSSDTQARDRRAVGSRSGDR